MKLFVNQNELVQDPKFASPVSLVELKRGDVAKLKIAFCDDGDILPFNGDTEIKVGAKMDFDGPFYAFADTYAADGDYYVVDLATNTTAINTALGKDNDPENDVASIDLKFELTWTDDGENWQSTKTIVLRVHNDIIGDGLEGLPIEPPTANDWLAAQLAARGIIITMGTESPTSGVYPNDSLIPSGDPPFSSPIPDVGLQNGKRAYFYDETTEQTIAWTLDLSVISGSIYTGAGWYAVNSSDGVYYVSQEDVATPDLVTQWYEITGTETDLSFSFSGSPGTFGETRICDLGTDTFEVWKCVREYPAKWIKLN